MLARRLLIALALLMAITALAAGLAPRESPLRDDASPTASASAEPAAEPVEATLDAQSDGQLVEARVGQIVRIVVESDELDSVELAELGTETADPESPAMMQFSGSRADNSQNTRWGLRGSAADMAHASASRHQSATDLPPKPGRMPGRLQAS